MTFQTHKSGDPEGIRTPARFRVVRRREAPASSNGALGNQTPNLFPGVSLLDSEPRQPSLFTATQARDEALARVEAAAPVEWREAALSAVYACCRTLSRFTSEDVWQLIEKPREPRALGPVLMRAVRLGYCRPAGFVTSGMTSRHAAPVRQYVSLLRRWEKGEAT